MLECLQPIVGASDHLEQGSPNVNDGVQIWEDLLDFLQQTEGRRDWLAKTEKKKISKSSSAELACSKYTASTLVCFASNFIRN